MIASDGNGANKIIPVLTWARKDSTAPYDTAIQPIGITNVRLQTSNGYSPHLFPEYITDWQYFYASAPRPGFMGRFLVAESGSRAPYWPTTNQNFGGQYNTPLRMAMRPGSFTAGVERRLVRVADDDAALRRLPLQCLHPARRLERQPHNRRR